MGDPFDFVWVFGFELPSEMRTRQALVNVVEFNDQLMAIEDRVSGPERRPL